MQEQKLKQQAEKFFLKGKWPKALNAFLRLSEVQPTDLRVRQKIGETLLRLGRKQEAQIIFRQVADLYMEDGQLHKAISVNHRLLELDRDDREIQIKLATLYERHGSGTLRDLPMEPDEIEQHVEEICKDDVLNQIQDLEERLTQQRRRADWQGALEEAIKLWKWEPSNIERRIIIAQILFELQRWKNASEVYVSLAHQLLRKANPLRALFMQAYITEKSLKGRQQEIAKQVSILFSRLRESQTNVSRKNPTKSLFQSLKPRSEIMEEMLEDLVIQPIDLTKIQPIPLLSQLPRFACEAFIEHLKPRSYREGETLFQKNDRAESLSFIAHGSVGLIPHGDEVESLILKEGELLGTFGFLFDGKRHQTAMAFSETEILEISKKDLEKLQKEFPEIKEIMDRLFSQTVLPPLLTIHPIFQSFSHEEILALSKHFQTHHYEESAFHVKEGQVCEELYFIRKGIIDLYCGDLFKNEAMCSLSPGSFFAELECITKSKLPHSYQSSGPVTLLVFKSQNAPAEIWAELTRRDFILPHLEKKSSPQQKTLQDHQAEFGIV